MGHKIINLADAQPGMKIASDVCGLAGGEVLLAAGAMLSEVTIAALARRGVSRIEVVEALSQEERALRIAEIDRRLDILFRHIGNDPLLRKLRKIIREHRLGKL